MKVIKRSSALRIAFILSVLGVLILVSLMAVVSLTISRLSVDVLLVSALPVRAEEASAEVCEPKVTLAEETRKEMKLVSRKGSSTNIRVYTFIKSYNSTQADKILASMERAYTEFNLKSYGMSFECFVAQACVESSFNPKTLGYSKDIGLYQLIPSTAKEVNKMYFKIPGFKHTMLYDIDLNCRFGACYLKYIFDKGYSVGNTLEIYNKWLRGLKCTSYRNKVFKVENKIVKVVC